MLSFSSFIFYEVQKLLLNCITTKLHFQYFVEVLHYKCVICELIHLNSGFSSGVPDFLGYMEYLERIH